MIPKKLMIRPLLIEPDSSASKGSTKITPPTIPFIRLTTIIGPPIYIFSMPILISLFVYNTSNFEQCAKLFIYLYLSLIVC